MDTPRVAIRCSQCGRLLREVKGGPGGLMLTGAIFPEGGWGKDSGSGVGTTSRPRAARCYDASPPPHQFHDEVTRNRFVCEHRGRRARSVPIGAQELLRRCAAALAGPGPAEVLI